VIAALYVERGGPYFSMPDVDPWDIKRDARTYNGPHPIVAHPPCGPWGCLSHLYRGSEHDCAPHAVELVRRFGGVLEHPAYSKLWRAIAMPRPDDLPDQLGGGFTVLVDQVNWGHVARKRTWLYIVGADRSSVYAEVIHGARPTHWIAGARKRRIGGGGIVPAGVKICSAQQRRRTPRAFAEWLTSIASRARRDHRGVA
jgi:hypothetical protein